MALRASALESKRPEEEKPKEEPLGEMRLDEEGKGYWHSFKKDKSERKVYSEPEKELKEEPKKKKRKK